MVRFWSMHGQNLIEEKIDQYIDSTRYIGLKDTLERLDIFQKPKNWLILINYKKPTIELYVRR